MTLPDNEYFSTWSDPKYQDTPKYQRTLDRFASPFIQGDVLDIGCGGLVYYETSNIRTWTGLECAQERIQQLTFLHSAPEAITTLIGDARTLPFPQDAFDTICSFFLLHHLGADNRKTSETHVLAALREARRILRPNGHLVVAENAPCFLHWPYQFLYPLLFRIAHAINGTYLPYFWPQNQLRKIAAMAGFTKCDIVEIRQEQWTHQPVLNFALPPFLDNRPISVMTLYIFE